MADAFLAHVTANPGQRMEEGARTRPCPALRARDCCWAWRGAGFGLPWLAELGTPPESFGDS